LSPGEVSASDVFIDELGMNNVNWVPCHDGMASSGCGVKRRPADIEVSYEYNAKQS
jgi:hypothetical protein